jgi:hypothetical protein
VSDRHTVQGLLGEFGRTIGLDDLELDEDDYCALLIDDSLVINMEFDDAGNKLVLYSLIGEPAGERTAAYDRLLRANYLGRETGAASLSLHPDGKGVVLSQWLPMPGLDGKRFTTELERFVNQTEAWTKRLPQLAASSEGEPAPASEFPVIRG